MFEKDLKATDELAQKYIENYKKYRGKPLRVLLGFYKGQYHKFLLSAFFFLIKHWPALFSSLLIANVINGVLAGGETAKHAIIVNVLIWLALLSVHLPANYMHTRLRSEVTRSTEAGLRAALVKKLQELSIPYHTRSQSGRLQSKIIRDVEAVETLSSQLFIGVLQIAINLAVMLGITAVKNRLIFLFFLLLGTMPSPKSREAGFFYGHPQNRMWPVLARLFGEETPTDTESRRRFLLLHQIAMWDVLSSCSIRGADDSSIRDPVPNDLRPILEQAPIAAIFCTGKKSFSLYNRYIRPVTGREAFCLPSTSPANCRNQNLETLTDAYRALLSFLG